MKKWQFTTTVGLGCICLAITIVLLIFIRSNQFQKMELQRQEESIRAGGMSQQISSNLLRDMANGAGKNANLRELLKANGFNVTAAPPPEEERNGVAKKGAAK